MSGLGLLGSKELQELAEIFLKASRECPEERGDVLVAVLLAAGIEIGRELPWFEEEDLVPMSAALLLLGFRIGRANSQREKVRS
jgi:hypothetical protein